MHTTRFSLSVALALCLVIAVPMWGQSTNTGTVVGTITDQSGAVVAGATVTLTDTSTNVPRSTTTNAAGRYIYVDVTPGT